jgi:hypothetical protein
MKGGTMITKNMKVLAVAMLIAIASFGCSGELTNNAAPVELVVTHTAKVGVVDISPNDDPDCEEDLGTVDLRVIPKNSSATGNLVAVRVNRYRVSYRRTDGGTIVPAPFVRSIDTLVQLNTTSATVFRLFELGVLQTAPLISLQPQNGGRDPETLRPYVRFEVILEVFGETLGGDNVYDSTSIPLEFCYACGGCS